MRTLLTIEEAVGEGDARGHRGGGHGGRNRQESSGVGVELPARAMCGGSSIVAGLVVVVLLVLVLVLVVFVVVLQLACGTRRLLRC